MMVIGGVEVLDVREAAAYVSRTPETVRRWIWSGRLPASRRGNRLLVRRSDLDALSGGSVKDALSLAEWAALLPSSGSGRAGSALDLLLEDRERRAGR